MARIPIIDLQDYLNGGAGADRAVAADIRDAFENVGFMALIHHGVPWSKVEALTAAAAAFHARPMAWKSSCTFGKCISQACSAATSPGSVRSAESRFASQASSPSVRIAASSRGSGP